MTVSIENGEQKAYDATKGKPCIWMIASINVQNANALLCKVVNVLTHNVLSQGIYMNSRAVAKQILSVAVHGFRVQRFRVAFLLKPDGINESQWVFQSNYSAMLCMN